MIIKEKYHDINCIIGSYTAKPGMSIPFDITAKPCACGRT